MHAKWSTIGLLGVAVSSVALNGLLLVTPDTYSENTPAIQATQPEPSTPIADDSENLELLSLLRQIQSQMATSQTELAGIKAAVAEFSAAQESPKLDEQAVAIREERKAEELARMQELLALDVPEGQRNAVMHDRWLQKNQEELWTLDEEMDRLSAMADDWIANNQ